MEQPLNPPPAQRALSLLSKSNHLCQKSAEVRPHQQEHVAHTRQSLGTLLFAMLSLFINRYRVLLVFFQYDEKRPAPFPFDGAKRHGKLRPTDDYRRVEDSYILFPQTEFL